MTKNFLEAFEHKKNNVIPITPEDNILLVCKLKQLLLHM